MREEADLTAAPALRPYLTADAQELAELFRSSIAELAAEDYDETQLEAWMSRAEDEEAFAAKLGKALTLVATLEGETVGFAALVISDIRPIREMGVWVAVGLSFTWVVVFTLFPALQRGADGFGRVAVFRQQLANDCQRSRQQMGCSEVQVVGVAGVVGVVQVVQAVVVVAGVTTTTHLPTTTTGRRRLLPTAGGMHAYCLPAHCHVRA